MINMIIQCGSKEEMEQKKTRMHEALKGSPAYIDSEIAICDNDDTSFYLVIGQNNDRDLKVTIGSRELIEDKEEVKTDV